MFIADGIGGSGSYEYRFWLNTGGSWVIVQDYTTTNTWSWGTAGLLAGTYPVVVHVRSIGSTSAMEAKERVDFMLSP